MDVTNEKWMGRLLKMAKDIAGWSKDESTKVGAVITTLDGKPVSWGFNGMPMGIDDTIPERHERPEKYRWMCHAERNAMDLASRNDLSDCVMFVTYASCPNCAQSIIQRNIRTVVVDANHTADKMPPRWIEEMTMADTMMKEAGVRIIAAYPDSPVDISDKAV
jgi:dCMP deaminase